MNEFLSYIGNPPEMTEELSEIIAKDSVKIFLCLVNLTLVDKLLCIRACLVNIDGKRIAVGAILDFGLERLLIVLNFGRLA